MNVVQRVVQPIRKQLSRLATGLLMMYTGFSANNVKNAFIQFREGVKYIFGMTAEQRTVAQIEAAIAGVPDSRAGVYKALLRNQLNYNGINDSFDATLASGFKSLNTIDFVRTVLDQTVYFDLVGTQPISAPTALGYELTVSKRPGSGTMDVEILSRPIQVGTRKLQTQFSVEIKVDLLRQVANPEQEFQKILAHEISSEFDADVISKLLSVAGESEQYTINQASPTTAGKQVSLAIHQVANQVSAATRRGANWVIVSPFVFSLLRLDQSLVLDPNAGPIGSAYLSYQGVLNSTIKVYVSPFFGTDALPHALVGYKGPSELDAGYYRLPYVALASSGVVVDPATFEPKVNLMTRFGEFFNSNGAAYYAKVNINFVTELLGTDMDSDGDFDDDDVAIINDIAYQAEKAVESVDAKEDGDVRN